MYPFVLTTHLSALPSNNGEQGLNAAVSMPLCGPTHLKYFPLFLQKMTPGDLLSELRLPLSLLSLRVMYRDDSEVEKDDKEDCGVKLTILMSPLAQRVTLRPSVFKQ